MSFVTRESIEAAQRQRRTIAPLGGDVNLRPITGQMRKRLFEIAAGREVTAQEMDDFTGDACAHCVLDENGQPLADRDWWLDQTPEVREEVWELIQAVSGLASKAIDDAKKNSEPTKRSCSSSDSVESPATGGTPTN